MTSGALPPLPPPSWRLRLFWPLWQVAAHLLVIPAIGLALWRSRREPLYRAHLSHRFGLGPVGPKGAVWVFAASLGETRAAAPLIERLLGNGHAVCLTHSSPAGLSAGQRLFDDPRVTHRYVPLDLSWALALFLARLRPSIGLVVEAEIWPAQLQVARWFRVPMVQVNGNLTERSIRRARGLLSLRLDLLGRFARVLTKSERHRDRYLAAGVDPARLGVPGELKFDIATDPRLEATGRALAATWASGRPVFLIASSVEGEETALLGIVRGLLPVARVIWAPRSPQRFDALSRRLTEAGIRIARRSRALGPDLAGDPGDADLLLADSIGEMGAWYAAADLVFVGATLVDHGGHSVVEPLAAGKPVLTGPSVWGVDFPAREASAEGALEILDTAETLGARALALLSEPGDLARITGRACAFAAGHGGAADRVLAELGLLAAAGPAPAVSVRPARAADRERLRAWRNDPEVRAASFTTGEIDAATHERWFAAALADPDREIWIAESDGVPSGSVRFSREDGAAEVHILLAREARGRGLARPALAAALAATRLDAPLWRARVRRGNAASLALFRSLGFAETGPGDPAVLERKRR